MSNHIGIAADKSLVYLLEVAKASITSQKAFDNIHRI